VLHTRHLPHWRCNFVTFCLPSTAFVMTFVMSFAPLQPTLHSGLHMSTCSNVTAWIHLFIVSSSSSSSPLLSLREDPLASENNLGFFFFLVEQQSTSRRVLLFFCGVDCVRALNSIKLTHPPTHPPTHTHTNHLALGITTVFAETRHALCLLESVAAAIDMAEPVLLVGETGTGKTTVVQRLARLAGRRLVVVNMSQQVS
jgi:ABC-type multidrug transport system fused ATPase/permease subunit